MTASTVRARIGGTAILLLALALGLPSLTLQSCSRRITSVDADYTSPDGTPGAAMMLVWSSEPNSLFVFRDVAPIGPDAGDPLLGIVPYSLAPPECVFGQILDATAATSYELFRREAGGGVRSIFDYRLTASRKWLEQHTEVYEFGDLGPWSHLPPAYVGRGAIGGRPTLASPLTNEAVLVSREVANISLQAAVIIEAPPSEVVTFPITWRPVPGAAFYVFQMVGDPRANIGGDIALRLRTGARGGLFPSVVRDQITLLIPGDASGFNLLDSGTIPAGTVVFGANPKAAPSPYWVRLAAFDTHYQLIGITRGEPDIYEAWRWLENPGNLDDWVTAEAQTGVAGDGTYGLYRYNACRVLEIRRGTAAAAVLSEASMQQRMSVVSDQLRALSARTASSGRAWSSLVRPLQE